MAEVKAELIRIQNINLYKSNINISDDVLDNNTPISGYSFEFAQQSKFSIEHKAFQLKLKILLTGKDSEGEVIDVTAEFGIEYVFLIENIEDLTHKEVDQDDYMIDAALGGTLMSIAYSTSRGLILQETQKSKLGGVILPVVDPMKIMLGNQGDD